MSASGWNYGDLLDALDAAVPPNSPALIHGTLIRTWAEFSARSNNLGRHFIEHGFVPDTKVAFYLRNSPAYSELLAACFKARLVHVNVNYRYVADELHYIFDNSDARIICYDREFAPQIDALRSRLPKVGLWLEVGDGEPLNNFAESFDALAATGAGAPLAIERSEEDLLLLYTGGTTGMPKGVMWTQGDHWRIGRAGAAASPDGSQPDTPQQHIDNVVRRGPGPCLIPCCPMMHGTGLFSAIAMMTQGGCILTLTQPSFDPLELWAAVEQHRATALAIVGDAFGKPMLKVLDDDPGRFQIESLQSMLSSGVMWSPEVKRGLLRHNANMVLTDSFGASEAVGFGRSDTTAEGTTEIGRFVLGEGCKVFTEDFREVQPGSGEVGFVARSGPIPRGYYKDPEKTAKTFPTVDGVRYSMPGDFCRVEADGSLILLGRGSVCINTAGEKVFPEEVEEVLKTHPSVADALVVGVPDDKWGQMVVAVVEPEPGEHPAPDVLKAHAREQLAGYKTPKQVLLKDDLERASNGKANYKVVTAYARAQLGAD
ncbi:MAG: acyl-CoA synthetase [Pseudomonadota bacterium]